MKKWHIALIIISIILLVGIPFTRKVITPIHYTLRAPQSMMKNVNSGSIHIELENRFFSSVDVEVKLWGASTPKEFYTFSDYNTEIPFTINSGAKAVIYLIRLKSNRGSFAFIGRIELPDNGIAQDGLQIITERSRYNPGDTVRLLALDYSTELGLIPNDKFILEIVDSRQNIINKEEISFEDGLLIHEFKLADKVNNGLWTLKVRKGNEVEETQFEVLHFERNRIELHTYTPSGYISAHDENVVLVDASHFAGGDINGSMLEINVSSNGQHLFKREKEITSQITSFVIPNKLIKSLHTLTFVTTYRDALGTESQEITLPIQKASSTILVYPQDGYILNDRSNTIYFKTFHNEILKDLKVLFENKQLNVKNVDKDIYSIQVPNTKSKLNFSWSNGSIRYEELVNLADWPSKPVRFQNVNFKNNTLSGNINWDKTYHPQKIKMQICDGSLVITEALLEANDKRSLPFSLSASQGNILKYHFIRNGEVLRTSSQPFSEFKNNSLSLKFENPETEPGKTERVDVRSDLKEDIVGALIISDTSLDRRKSGFQKLKDNIVPSSKQTYEVSRDQANYPNLLKSSVSTNAGQIKTVALMENKRFSENLKDFFICIVIASIIGGIYMMSHRALYTTLFVVFLLGVLSAMLLPALGSARSKAARSRLPDMEGQASIKSPKIRKSFKDNLAFKKIRLKDGKFAADVKMADNLTKWKAEFIGFPKGSKPLYATDSTVSTKDLFIECSLPTFYVKNDKTFLPLTVYDKKKEGGELTVIFPEEIKTDVKSISLPAGQTRHDIKLPIEFLAKGDFKLSLKVENENNNDQIEQDVSVKGEGIRRKLFENYELSLNKSVNIKLPNPTNSISNEHYLKIESGQLSETLSSIESLIRTPTGCFEQTSSKNLPNIVVYEYLKSRNFKPQLQETTRQKLREAYQRLLSYEVKGGGFSLYGKGSASIWLTTYGILQFSLMSKHIYVDPDVIDRSWIKIKSRLSTLPEDEKVFAMWSALQANVLTQNEFQIYTDEALKLIESKNLWVSVLACHVLYDCNYNYEKLKAVSEKIISRILKKEGLFETPCSRSNKSAFVTTSAFALDLARMMKLNSIMELRNIIFSHKRGAGWYDTFSTAFSIRALNQLQSNEIKKIEILSDTGKRHILELDPDNQEALKFPLNKEELYTVTLIEGNSLYFSRVTEVEIPYGKEESFKPNFSLTSNVIKNSKKSVNILFNVKCSSSINSENPMIELPIAAGLKLYDRSMTQLIERGIIRQYEIKEDSLILYLKDLDKSERQRFSISFYGDLEGEVNSAPGIYYEYYRKEATGWFKLPSIKF